MTTPRRHRLGMRAICCALACGLVVPVAASARTAPPTPAPATTASPRPHALCRPPNRAFSLRVPGSPLSLAQSLDGCYLFVGFAVTAADSHRGLALLHREGRSYALVRTFDMGGSTIALSTSRDGTLLAASVLDRGVVVLDVARAIGGDPASVAADLADPSLRDARAVAFDANASHLYASDQADSAVLAIDVAAARAGVKPALFGHRVPLDRDPVAFALSADGTKLYAVLATRSPANNVAATCRSASAARAGLQQPDGVVAVLDLAHADRDGVPPTLGRIDAGCTPDGIAVSSDGAVVWVSSHDDRAIVAYDAAQLASEGPRAAIARTALTFAPDVLGAIGGGDYLVAAGYDRAADLQHDLAIVPRATSLGRSTLKARLEIGRFSRGLLAFVDGSGAIVASYSAQSVSFYPTAYLMNALEPAAGSARSKRRPRTGRTRR